MFRIYKNTFNIKGIKWEHNSGSDPISSNSERKSTLPTSDVTIYSSGVALSFIGLENDVYIGMWIRPDVPFLQKCTWNNQFRWIKSWCYIGNLYKYCYIIINFNYIIKKITSIAIRTSFYFFRRRNKEWTDPELMTLWYSCFDALFVFLSLFSPSSHCKLLSL